MGLIIGPGSNPFSQSLALAGLQFLVSVRRGHSLLGVAREDAPDKLTGLRLARHDRAFLERHRAHIQTQLGFALILVRPVATEAMIREDGADIAIETDLRGLSGLANARSCPVQEAKQ
jgi:hypothetical protein